MGSKFKALSLSPYVFRMPLSTTPMKHLFLCVLLKLSESVSEVPKRHVNEVAFCGTTSVEVAFCGTTSVVPQAGLSDFPCEIESNESLIYCDATNQTKSMRAKFRDLEVKSGSIECSSLLRCGDDGRPTVRPLAAAAACCRCCSVVYSL